MDDKKFDAVSAVNLFSKVERISFGFLKTGESEIPCISLYFRNTDNKQAHDVFRSLKENLAEEKLRLSVNENGGDFLTITFLWSSRFIPFVTSPDHYYKADWKQFRSGVFYGDHVRVFFLVSGEDQDLVVLAYKKEIPTSYLNCTYYEYVP